MALYGLSSVHENMAAGGGGGGGSYMGTNPVRLRPHFWTSFNLNYFLRDPNSKYNHIGSYSFSI